MLSDLLSVITDNDIQKFQQFLSERNKRKEGRSIALFKASIQGKEKQLKDQLGVNAYNVLKMRLTGILTEFLSQRVFEGELTKESQIIRLLVLARKMLQLSKLKTGEKLLLRAEKMAIEIQHFSLLNEIYHSLIEMSHATSSEEQEALLLKLEENTSNFLLQERLNIVFAQVKRIFTSNTTQSAPVDLNTLIEENFLKYGISQAKGYGLKSLFQLATIVDYSAARTRSYHTIDLFFADKIERLRPEELANERNHLYHIDLLYLLANIHFRQRDFKKSQHYLKQMQAQMKAHNGKFYDVRLEKYQLLTALNFNFTGKYQKALTSLDSVEHKKKDDTEEQLQIALTRIMILAQQEDFQSAALQLKKLFRTDAYYKRIVGIEWVVNKRFIEILTYVASEKFDFAFSCIENLSRQHKDFFNDEGNNQIKPFLRVLKYYLNHPDSIQTDAFRNYVEKTIPWKPKQEDDIFFISVYAWLKAKMTGRNTYEVTLELVRNDDNKM